jgi:hypothetical protein
MEQWDVQSRHFFHFGHIVVGPHDNSRSAHEVAGFALLMMLMRYDLHVMNGGSVGFTLREPN